MVFIVPMLTKEFDRIDSRRMATRFKPFDNIDQSLQRVRVLADKLGQQTHAGLTMVVAAALDRLLEEALSTKMVKLNREIRDKVFGEFGHLQGFSAKINMGFALGIVDRENYTRLTKIRKARNLFAHTDGPLHFASEPIFTVLSLQQESESGVPLAEQFIAIAKAAELGVVQGAGVPNRGLIAAIEAVS